MAHWILWFLIAIAALAIALTWMSRGTEKLNRRIIDDWIDDTLAQGLAEKLRMSKLRIKQSLRGDPELEVVSAVTHHVRAVKLVVRRKGDRRRFDLRLEIEFSDGTSFAAVGERGWDDLPAPIRAEFLRGGAEQAERPWTFPWSTNGSQGS